MYSFLHDCTHRYVDCHRYEYIGRILEVEKLELEAVEELEHQVASAKEKQRSECEYESGVLSCMKTKLKDYEKKAQELQLPVSDVAARKNALKELMEGTSAALERSKKVGVILQKDLEHYNDLVARKRLEVGALEAEHAQLGRAQGGLHMRPMPMVYISSKEPCTSHGSLDITNCVLCSFPFPNFEIVISSCRHLYHPWCSMVNFSQSDKCCARGCSVVQPTAWTASFGWRSVPGWGQSRTGGKDFSSMMLELAPTIATTVVARSEAARARELYAPTSSDFLYPVCTIWHVLVLS